MKILGVRSGRVKTFSNLAGRVGSRSFQISRVGLGWVKKFSNVIGRIRSGQEVLKISGVWSGHDPRETGHSRVGPAGRASMSGELFSSDPRVGFVGPILCKLIASCARATLVSSCPRARTVKKKKFPLPARRTIVPILRAHIIVCRVIIPGIHFTNSGWDETTVCSIDVQVHPYPLQTGEKASLSSKRQQHQQQQAPDPHGSRPLPTDPPLQLCLLPEAAQRAYWPTPKAA